MIVGLQPHSSRYQFERLGYFCADVKDSQPGKPVFHPGGHVGKD